MLGSELSVRHCIVTGAVNAKVITSTSMTTGLHEISKILPLELCSEKNQTCE